MGGYNMSSKEAFERLLKYAYINASEFIIKYGYSALNDVELIKQDLDRLEQLEDNIKIHKETIKMQHNQIEKLEKVIEILKRFNFTIYTIKYNDNETEFKIYTDCLLETQELTQEEYDLLKEYL